MSHVTRWSTLSKVGSAPAMRLTILIPLIGVFLIFNQATQALLAWPTFFLEDLGLEATDNLPTGSLYFVYFGLCLLGIGSVVFALLCPREISDEPNIDRYVVAAPSAASPVIAKDDFRTVLRLKFDAEQGHEQAEYPDELEGDFHALMEELYAEVDFGDGAIDGMPEVMLPSGYLDFTELARLIWNNVRVDWAVSQPFYDAAPKFARDIAFVKYKSLDYTRFTARVAVALVYFAGFLLLLKPTAHVFIHLALTLVLGR